MLALLLSSLALAAPPSAEAFEAWTGARLVFEAEALPGDGWFELITPLPEARRERAAAIALAEARHFPPGTLADNGLRAVGLFAAVGSRHDDGYHRFDEGLGGYAYYGMSDGRSAVVAAYYSDRQLPLTLHHEWYHHLDAQVRADDDARLARALSGVAPYPGLRLTPDELASLRARRRHSGPILRDAVGAYSEKSTNEDQAETARHLHAHLVDGLLQVAEHPELRGSQRLLHVLAEEQAAGVPTRWLLDLALERAHAPGRHPRIRPDGDFVVWGGEDEHGVNLVLRRDVAALGREAAALSGPADLVARVALIADYHAFIDARWEISPGTRAAFEAARTEVVEALPESHQALATALGAASLEELASLLDPDGAPRAHPTELVSEAAAEGIDVNPWIAEVDRVLPQGWREAVRAVQPATVRIQVGRGAASGVVIASDGLILTAAHVPDRVGRELVVATPDGGRYPARCVALDARLDLALLRIDDEVDLPAARIAPEPPAVGDPVAIVGQPGATTPGGRPTGYQPFHVSAGHVRLLASDPLGSQSLGGVGHDAWTYWGHSGSPLFDEAGGIVALHNSWNPDTGMRHAVTWEAIVAFVERSRGR